MVDRDPGLESWAKERQDARQAKNEHAAYTFGMKGGSGPQPGWGGIEIKSSDNEKGSRELEVRVRPVLLGLVEWRVDLRTQSVAASKPHSKGAYVYTTPTAARELAARLIDAADEAEKRRPRPRRVK